MKQLLAVAMIMATGTVFAQTETLYECIYNYRANAKDGDKDLSETTDCILQIGEDLSKFYDYAAYRLDSVSAIKNADEEKKKEIETEYQKADKYFEQLVMTDLAKDQITVFGDMAPDRFKYIQKLPLSTWNTEPGTETICGYECKKAVGEYGGRQWTVWYAEEIPVPFGPWKMSGLPGLVMKATDSEGLHDFEATSFRKGTGKIEAPKYPNINTIKADQFIERKNKFNRDPMGSVNPESITSIAVFPNNSITINGVRIRNYPVGYQPLEFTKSELENKSKADQKKSEGKAGKNHTSIDDFFEDAEVVGVGSIKR